MTLDEVEDLVESLALTEAQQEWVPVLTTVISLILTFLALKVAFEIARRGAASKRSEHLALCFQQSKNRLSWFLLVVLCLSQGLLSSPLAESMSVVFTRVVGAVFVIQVLIVSNVWLSYIVHLVLTGRGGEGPDVQVSLKDNLSKILIATTWTVAFLFLLDNFGFNVGAVLAGLGVGGIAIGLALQSTLGDIFASFIIQIDKPFKEGDFVIIGQDMGFIQSVGLKTSKVRGMGGEILVFPNNVLVSQALKNYMMMAERRVVFRIGVEYAIPQEFLKALPGEIRAIVESQPKCRFDRSHFCDFGDSALLIETVYYIGDKDYDFYMTTHEQVLLSIRELLHSHGVSIAFPTRTLELGHSFNSSSTIAQVVRGESDQSLV